MPKEEENNRTSYEQKSTARLEGLAENSISRGRAGEEKLSKIFEAGRLGSSNTQ